MVPLGRQSSLVTRSNFSKISSTPLIAPESVDSPSVKIMGPNNERDIPIAITAIGTIKASDASRPSAPAARLVRMPRAVEPAATRPASKPVKAVAPKHTIAA